MWRRFKVSSWMVFFCLSEDCFDSNHSMDGHFPVMEAHGGRDYHQSRGSIHGKGKRQLTANIIAISRCSPELTRSLNLISSTRQVRRHRCPPVVRRPTSRCQYRCRNRRSARSNSPHPPATTSSTPHRSSSTTSTTRDTWTSTAMTAASRWAFRSACSRSRRTVVSRSRRSPSTKVSSVCLARVRCRGHCSVTTRWWTRKALAVTSSVEAGTCRPAEEAGRSVSNLQLQVSSPNAFRRFEIPLEFFSAWATSLWTNQKLVEASCLHLLL